VYIVCVTSLSKCLHVTVYNERAKLGASFCTTGSLAIARPTRLLSTLCLIRIYLIRLTSTTLDSSGLLPPSEEIIVITLVASVTFLNEWCDKKGNIFSPHLHTLPYTVYDCIRGQDSALLHLFLQVG